MKCPACKAEVEDGADLCLECGEPMGDSPAATLARQENVIRPVGSTDAIAINVRVISATHRDLQALMTRIEPGLVSEHLTWSSRDGTRILLNAVTPRPVPMRQRAPAEPDSARRQR